MNMSEINKRRGPVTKRPTEEELCELYMKYTAREIAEMYGVSSRTVEAWVYNYRKAHQRGE